MYALVPAKSQSLGTMDRPHCWPLTYAVAGGVLALATYGGYRLSKRSPWGAAAGLGLAFVPAVFAGFVAAAVTKC